MNIKKFRDRIDRIDERILSLLNERAEQTLEIGKIKHNHGLSIYSPNREKEVFQKLASLNKGPLSNKSLKAIYREIMSGALSLEKELKVAYLGPELTFTHMAAMDKFGDSLFYEPCKSITDVFNEVEKSRCDYGVVPIENSTEGAVNHTLDMFVNSDLKICAEIYLDISQNLLGHTDDIKKIKYIYSRPEVFGQCRIWLETNAPHAILKDAPSTSEAAHMVADKKDSACIASILAKEKYGLKLVSRSIEDNSNNVTRFLVIGKAMPGPTTKDKTSIVFSLKDKIGALHDMLDSFKKSKINLTKIESRPSKLRAWKYYFFVDMEGHIANKKIKETLDRLEKNCAYYKLLGSYPVNE